jgi:hypothetical protein
VGDAKSDDTCRRAGSASQRLSIQALPCLWQRNSSSIFRWPSQSLSLSPMRSLSAAQNCSQDMAAHLIICPNSKCYRSCIRLIRAVDFDDHCKTCPSYHCKPPRPEKCCWTRCEGTSVHLSNCLLRKKWRQSSERHFSHVWLYKMHVLPQTYPIKSAPRG